MKARDWLLVLLVSVLIHVLFFSLFRPLPRTVSKSFMKNRSTLFLEEKELDRKRDDPFRLRYWLRFTDPEQLLKPNYNNGFSMFLNRGDCSIPPPGAIAQNLFETSSGYRIPAAEMPPERSPAVFAAGSEIPVFPHAGTPLPASRPENVRYPLWIDDAGRSWSGLFLSDEESLRILNKHHSPKPSVLRLTFGQDLIPLAELIRSCGDQRLDILAIRQLKIRKENFDSGNPRIQYFKVIWQAPKLNDILGEKQP